MVDNNKDIFKLVADRLEADKVRHSPIEELDDVSIREMAVKEVAAIFREQLLPPVKNGGPGIKLLHGVWAIEQYFETLTPDEQSIATVVQQAEHDYYAFRALGTLASLGYSQRSECLRRWEKDVLAGLKTDPKMPRGPSPVRDLHRNMIVGSQLKRLANLGVAPTRNEATSLADSGCDIVVEALKSVGLSLSYSAVEAIWKNRDKHAGMPLFAALLSDAVELELTDKEPSEK